MPMTEVTSRLSTALADRYKIERHLGEGGMATVYLAEDPKRPAMLGRLRRKPRRRSPLADVTKGLNIPHPNLRGSRLV